MDIVQSLLATFVQLVIYASLYINDYSKSTMHHILIDRISQLSERYGSDRQLMLAAGIPQTTLSALRRGTLPRVDKLVKIANVADVSLDWLCGLVKNNYSSPTVAASEENRPLPVSAPKRPDTLLLSDQNGVRIPLWHAGKQGSEYVAVCDMLCRQINLRADQLIAIPDKQHGLVICQQDAPINDGLWGLSIGCTQHAFRYISRTISGSISIKTVSGPEQVSEKDFADASIGRVVYGHESLWGRG